MKKVAIITLAVALEGEKGYSRFRSLAQLLSESYKVDIITSTFQHWEKLQRDTTKILKNNRNINYGIKFAYEPGYKKNVDIKRMISHKIVVKNILKILKENSYDLIYCIIPDNQMAAAVSRYANKKDIRLIIDVEDLWPEAMQMVIRLPRIFDKVLFFSWRRDAKTAYGLADGIIGTSDEYRDVPVRKYGIHIANRKTVYVGCDLDYFDNGVEKNIEQIEKKNDEFWVVYAGNLGSSYDIPTLIRAAQKLFEEKYTNIIVKILGGGPLESEFKKIAEKKECNVEFVGYTPYETMGAYLVKSDVTINSFIKSAPQSIVTKIGDYLAAGKPLINTCSSPEFRNKVKNDGFGINIEAEDVDALVNAIKEFYEDADKCKTMGKRAREIAEEQFDRKTSYICIVEMIHKLLWS